MEHAVMTFHRPGQTDIMENLIGNTFTNMENRLKTTQKDSRDERGDSTARLICRRYILPWRGTLQTILLFLLAQSLLIPASAYPQFSEQSPAFSLQTIAIDTQSGAVFVGAVNRVYRLNSDLGLEGEAVTGPVQDSPECPPRQTGCPSAVSTDNYNKVLLVDGDQLIVCGTIYQGVCDILSATSLGVLSNTSFTEISVNTEYGTTVAFVGNGPSGMKTLYVGSSTSEWFRGSLWTLSSRQIPSDLSSSDLFKRYNDNGPQSTNPSSITIPTETISNSPPSQNFNISYVAGFTASDFSYFIALQPKIYNSPSNYYTKLARVCQQDDHFYSYIELPLQCYVFSKGARTLYNLAQSAYVGTVGANVASSTLQPGDEVLYVVFSQSDGMTVTPTANSAVCMYPISQINNAFWNRRLGCAQKINTDRTDIDWLGSVACGTSQSMIDTINATGPSYCHMASNIAPLGGNFPIEATALYSHPSLLTSIATTVHLDETVIFLGDQEGKLKRLRLTSTSTAELYEETTIDDDGGMVKNGLLLSPDENHVYVMTETKVTKVPVEECEAYTTYEECVGVGRNVSDPYCGWCTLKQQCTRGIEFECEGVDDPTLPYRWLTEDETNTVIMDVTPPNSESSGTVRLTLMVENLPALDNGEAYQCVFGDLGPKAAAVHITPDPNLSQVTCYTPSSIPEPTDGFTSVELSLQHTVTQVHVVSTEFLFYKCTTFTSCSQCVAQEFGCNWCAYENQCTGSTSSCQQEGIILGTGTPSNSSSDRIGQDFCPRIDIGNRTEILISAGGVSQVSLSVANAPLPLPGQANGYDCIFSYEGQEILIPADLNDSTLDCNYHSYDYESDAESVSGSMIVRWNGEYQITDGSIPIVLFKCAVNRPNCGLCLSADPKFGCGWCSDVFDCTTRADCQGPDMGSWLMEEDAVCPDPTIREIKPEYGHLAGGTYLTIYGYNLGLTAADISSISVAGIPCIIDQDSYVTALQISCTTASSSRPTNGMVEVTIGNSGGQTYEAVSDTTFSYVLPKITGVSPSQGPASGGSLVSILGHSLDAGSSSSANLVTVPCQIVSATSSELLCLSGEASEGTMGYVSMIVDGHYVEGSSIFEYQADPIITKISRFNSIGSGSLEMIVDGRNFDTINWPQLGFSIGPHQLMSNCSGTDTQLVCMTPSVLPLNVTLPFPVPITNISMVLDGVMEYSPLQNNGQISGLDDEFVFQPDPIYYRFQNDKMELEYGQRKFVMISGDNLTLAYQEGDVRVTVGGQPCTDVVVKLQQLTCYAPEEAPSSQVDRESMFEVKVYHGALETSVGFVEYLPAAVPLALIVGSVAGGALFLLALLIMVVCVASYRKNHTNERIFKQMEEQRDALELTVAQECKEAFAELQTGVLSITHDIKGYGIPTLDYRTYVVKSLFPDNQNHPVLRELSVAGVRKDFVHKGLWHFGQLLSTKSFLLLFVRVLEEQRTLSTRDFSNVASLLVVAFQGKMEYCTDVLKTLVARAIKQHVAEGPHSARVFMRRGSSVVEKMVAQWLSVLLYNHLQDVAGEPLFKLFYAIKQQVEKGPVDAVTGEARYSLTENKLIRQQVEVKQLTLKAQGPDRNTAMVEVKVLDCDTISQTKDKILDTIYKTSPYSQRPHKDDLDLEWYDRAEGKLLLFDDDGLRVTEGGWRRFNTLAHYQIPDGATVFLLQAQGGTGSLHSNHSTPSRVYANVNAININIHQTPSSSMSPMITLDHELRVWHLVKPDDHEPHENGVTDRKMMAEIYLPRLLTTKTILHKFVDDVVTTIFMLDGQGSSLPLAIKYLYDFLDEQAQENGITDPAVIHAWKSNCLPLRFWVNLIKNPDMIFDIHKTDTVDACLSVVAQCIMEACSVSEQHLNKNSPASKLLYAKDIPTYKEYVSQYYRDIQSLPVISDQDMNAMLAEHSQGHHYDFYTLSALNELYFGYACKYRSELMSALDEDSSAIKQGHAEKILEIERIMSKSF